LQIAGIAEQMSLLLLNFVPLKPNANSLALISLLELDDKDDREDLLEDVLLVWEDVVDEDETDVSELLLDLDDSLILLLFNYSIILKKLHKNLLLLC